jgi:hypothetical protein
VVPRVTFLLIAAFWVAMNVLLWRAEYSSRGNGFPVPVDLVCRKILTAPDASSLSVYQDGQRTGFCEFSTGVEQEMAQLDAEQPPPAGLVARAGYQIRLNGNVAVGGFTNRVQFDARVSFSPRREWRELNLKIATHFATVKIRAVATNQTVSVQVVEGDLPAVSRIFTFADLQNPGTLLQAFNEDFSGGSSGGVDLSAMPQLPVTLAQSIHWEAHRDRLMIGHEAVTTYRLETLVLGNPVVIYVGTLGEILRVDLPGHITAKLDEWSQ